MDNLLLYLLKVSAGTALFYLLYLLFFRKDTFYQRNRIFLILTLILPAIFPLLKIPVTLDNALQAGSANTPDNVFFSETSSGTTMSATINSFDYNNFFVLIYFTIAGLLLLRMIISLIITFRIIKKGAVKKSQFPRVIISENKYPPFSFFPYAVIPAEDYISGKYADILDHEFAHIRQGHTFDLLLSELFIAIQWFNPFVWLIKRSIILNHEYLADHVSLCHNKSTIDYQYRLLNFQTGLKNISLAHSFNSLIKNRIIMINKKPTRKYATVKNILILPVVAFTVYAFATPEYNYVAPVTEPMNIYQAPVIMQKEVKGIVLNEEGKPLAGVNIGNTGTMGYARATYSGTDGRFILYNAEDGTYLSFSLRGYKSMSIKADFKSEMVIKMVKDPDYKEPNVRFAAKDGTPLTNPIIVLDGIITTEPPAVINSKLGNELGTIINLSPKEATVKYGEAGKNGATEIYTRKKATELGIKFQFRRNGPDDYPTFQGEYYLSFNDWVVSKIKYPSEATARGIQGRIIVNFTVEADGSVSKVSVMGKPDPLLSDAAVKAVQASPKWDPAKNPEAKDPFTSMVAIKFELPDKIIKDDTYVMVEEMPRYPGGDVELLNFIKANTKYPEAAKAEKAEGMVITRFVVNKNGDVEEPVILKGVHPLLDAEALRVVSRFKGFSPGLVGGNPVNVYYMVPVKFSLSAPEPLFIKTKEDDVLKFIGMNTGYPQEARNASDTGRVYVVVKLEKGGYVKECKAFTEKTGINVPFLPEVVIVGNKSSTAPADLRPGKATGNGLAARQAECIRVANTLTVTEIPDWQDKNLEFALTFIFTLK
jgi:TonB family protein